MLQSSSVRGRRIAKAPVRQLRSSARGGSVPLTARRAAEGAERARLPGRPAWREPGRGATCRAGRGAIPVVSGETDDARRGGCRMAGGPDVARHAAAAACDGKGIRVDGQYRTTVRGPATLTGTGSPIRTQHHRPRPLLRPRGAPSPSRSRPCGPHRGARSPRFDSAHCQSTFPLTRADAAAGDRGRGCGARLRDGSVPVDADGGGCTTSPGRRTRWPRPASRRSPPGGISAIHRSISASPVETSCTTAERSRPGRTPRDEPRGRAPMRSSQAGYPDGPWPGGAKPDGGAIAQATYAAQSFISTRRRSNRSLRR